MTQSKKVFLSSDVIFSYIDRAHPKHDQATAFIRFFAENEYQLFTDILCLNNVYAQIYAEISTSLAKDFLRTLALSHINLLYPDESDQKQALKTLTSSTAAEFTYTKALMLVLSDKRKIPQICTFDYLPQLFGINLFYLPL